MNIHVSRNGEETMKHHQSWRPLDRLLKTIRPSANWLQRSAARSEKVEPPGSWRPDRCSAARLAPSGDLFSFTAEDRCAHYRRSLRATLVTFAAVASLFALFFGLVAVCGGL